jgi:hypothetical protein
MNMNSLGGSKDVRFSSTSGLEINCHNCGCPLPLLHPHIILERTDEDENLICERCYQDLHEAGKNKFSGNESAK